MDEAHGRRLLPSLIDTTAKSDPDRAWASVQFPGESGFQDVSIASFANAINRITHWIVSQLGTPAFGPGPPVLAYIGASDLRYYVLFMAVVKAGYVPLFVSHLNSAAANASLFGAVNCNVLLCGLENLDSIQIDDKDAKVLYVPGYEATFDRTQVSEILFTKSFDEAVNEPLAIMHTSGSTGMPKPITYTHGWLAAADSSQDIPDYEGSESEPRLRTTRSRYFLGFPPFHPAGLTSGIRDSIYFGTTIVFPRHDRPMDAACVIDAIDHGHFEGAALLPHVLEEIARNTEALHRISKLRYIDWVGGPITQQAGDLISSRTTLNNAYASTELGASAQLHKKDRSLWQWYFFNPLANGFDFRPVPGEKDLFELFVVRDLALDQPVFRIFPDLDEWPMRDLFVPHPILPHHWRVMGRSDDLLVFQNGSKILPGAVEAAVKSAPGVKECIMFGSGRVRPGILVEPKDPSILDEGNTPARMEFLDKIFSIVDENNRRVPSNGVVVRELLALTKQGKPLPRTSKGTLQRKAALELYRGELDALYEAAPPDVLKVADYRIGSQSKH